MKHREVPRGFKDFLPAEVKLKRHIEREAGAIFASWGYQEIITPAVEYLEVIEATSSVDRQELFLFQNRDGRLLALRPEMTIPVARVASSHLRNQPLPLRLFYRCNIFRHTQPQKGRYSEFWQIGVEMLGARGERADAEVIALAVETMRRLGVKDFQLSINHSGIFNSLLAESGLSLTEREELREMVTRKDLVSLEQKLTGMALPRGFREILLKLPVLYGGMEVFDMLPDVSGISGAAVAVNELRSLFSTLQDFGVGDMVVVDLGVVRDLDYYTGVVFEGYSSQLGYPLLGGGRYDRVMEHLGWPNPATGFAIGVERVMLAMQEQDSGISEPRCVVAGHDLPLVMKTAERLRKQGWIVWLDVMGQTREELEAVCRENNCRLVLVDQDTL